MLSPNSDLCCTSVITTVYEYLTNTALCVCIPSAHCGPHEVQVGGHVGDQVAAHGTPVQV